MSARRDDVRRRRRDRWAQLAVVLLAVAAGVVAALLGTHRAWEREPVPSPTTTVPASVGPNVTTP